MWWLTLFCLLQQTLFRNALSIESPYVVTRIDGGECVDNYLPNWKSLDSRPLPAWYDEAKIGIFIHWGVFSVPSFGSEWFWINWASSNKSKYTDFMSKNYAPGFTYQDFARDFTAEFFNAKKWTKLFQKSGAKYVVLTSKHHEGYTLWPSKYSFSWNSVDVGPHRDLIAELATAVRANSDLKFGLYHSLYEWFNPLYLDDVKNDFATDNFPKSKIVPEMKELVSTYRPDVLWSDGDWQATDKYWHSEEFLAWLYNESPVRDSIVVNDRWGKDVPCHHGGFYTCRDRYNPGSLQSHKWENAMTLDKMSWGYRRNAELSDYMAIEELIKTLVTTVSCGGNLLVNIGPARDGTIAPIFEERLLQLGRWLQANGEAVYASRPWERQNDTEAGTLWYTSGGASTVYAISLVWPRNNVLTLVSAKQLFVDRSPVVNILGEEGAQPLTWHVLHDTVLIDLPDKAVVEGQWAWTFKIHF